jgi:hypothetical protein
VASYNVAVVCEAVVKRVHYISEMSQNYGCLNHRGVNLKFVTVHGSYAEITKWRISDLDIKITLNYPV